MTKGARSDQRITRYLDFAKFVAMLSDGGLLFRARIVLVTPTKESWDHVIVKRSLMLRVWNMTKSYQDERS